MHAQRTAQTPMASSFGATIFDGYILGGLFGLITPFTEDSKFTWPIAGLPNSSFASARAHGGESLRASIAFEN